MHPITALLALLLGFALNARAGADAPAAPPLAAPPGAAAASDAQTRYRPALDPREWRADVAGPRSRVLVLGSPHLSQLPRGFDPRMLAPLIDKLVAFAPDLVTHEGLSGEQCDTLRRHPQTYPDMFATYCNDLSDAQRSTGLNFAAARIEVERLLHAWPRQPTPAQRRRLTAVLFAAGERPSGLVQWLQLPVPERVAGNGVIPAWLPLLNRSNGKFNETLDVAAVVAARLGHTRLWPVDDHTADEIQGRAGAGFEAALRQHWKTAADPSDPVMKEYGERSSGLTSGAAVLDFYRFINQPLTQRSFVAADYRSSLRDPSPEHYGRQYVAWWETRNLRMVAHIRAAFGNRPGAKVLNLVGASHKAYYEAYLDLMHEVELVDAQDVLR